MMVIYKYTENIDKQCVNMPASAVILNAEIIRGGGLVIWALVDPEDELVERKVWIMGTGWAADDDWWKTKEYLTTYFEGPYVWHAFVERV